MQPEALPSACRCHKAASDVAWPLRTGANTLPGSDRSGGQTGNGRDGPQPPVVRADQPGLLHLPPSFLPCCSLHSRTLGSLLSKSAQSPAVAKEKLSSFLRERGLASTQQGLFSAKHLHLTHFHLLRA